MYKKLLGRLNIASGEVSFTVLLSVSAIILGAFIASYDIISHALFFEKWKQEDIALVYIFSGALGIILFMVYTFLHKRFSFKVVNFIGSLIILLIAGFFLVSYMFSFEKQGAFFMLVSMFPVNLLSLIIFWRYQRKVLLPEQTRRLFPIIETGLMIGIAGASILIILLLSIFNYHILIGISLLALLLFFLIQFPLNLAHHKLAIFNHKKEPRIPVRSSLFILWTTRYTRLLLFFVLISAIIGFYLHFGFIYLSRLRFSDIDRFSLYYALFTGIMFVFIYLVDKFLIHRILYSYDSPYSLVLMPVGMVLLLAFSLIGTLVLQKWSSDNPTIYFIIIFAINKVAYETSKNVIQLPSFRSLFPTLDIRFLQTIYPRLEGMVVMVGLLIAGGIIIGVFSLISDLVLFLVIAIALTGLWFWVAVRLIKKYKLALQDSYRKLRIARSKTYGEETYTEKIRKILVGDDPVKVINAMQISARVEPLTYENGLLRMLSNPQPVIQRYVLKCIENESLVDLLPDLKKFKPSSDDTAALLDQIISDFEKKKALLKKGLNIDHLVNSRNFKDRILAAEIIGTLKDASYTSALVNLTREFEPVVKVAAVKAMARISSADHSYLLIEQLSSPHYHAYAFEALISIGDPALDYLERLFINPNTSDSILSRVIRIYGKVGTPKAIDLLLNKFENQSKRITTEAIAALHDANFQANATNLNKILTITVRVINIIGWNYLVVTALYHKEQYRELREAYEEEISNNYDMLFDVLALAYNARTIREIKELLYNGSPADISHAIEMLDHFVYEDIKPVLFPVIENISPGERIRHLQYYFPIESMTDQEIISSTLTRDYNILSIYPRLCAMQIAINMPDFEVNHELIANLFHPNRLLREVAATVIHKINPMLYESVAERLDPQIRLQLKDTLNMVEKGEKMLLIDKFRLLKNSEKFYQMQENLLIEFAHTFTEIKYAEGTTIDLRQHMKEHALFLLVKGTLHFLGEGIQHEEDTDGQLFYANVLLNSGITNVTFREETILLTIDDESIEELLFDYTEVAHCVLNCVEQFKIAG